MLKVEVVLLNLWKIELGSYSKHGQRRRKKILSHYLEGCFVHHI